MKKLLITVRCVTESASDFPQSFYIELTTEQIHRIKTLSGILRQVDAQAICEFFREGCWSRAFVEFADVKCDNSGLQSVASKLHKEEVRVDVPKLNVTKGHFYFSAIPNGFSEEFEVKTEEVSLSELESSNVFVDLD